MWPVSALPGAHLQAPTWYCRAAAALGGNSMWLLVTTAKWRVQPPPPRTLSRLISLSHPPPFSALSSSSSVLLSRLRLRRQPRSSIPVVASVRRVAHASAPVPSRLDASAAASLLPPSSNPGSGSASAAAAAIFGRVPPSALARHRRGSQGAAVPKMPFRARVARHFGDSVRVPHASPSPPPRSGPLSSLARR